MTKIELAQTIKNFKQYTAGRRYKTIYADPPWQFQNRTGKMAPENKRLNRYPTMSLDDIKQIPVAEVADDTRLRGNRRKVPSVFVGAKRPVARGFRSHESMGIRI